MLEPESNPPEHLLRAEVEAALLRLVKDAGGMARARKMARVLASGLPAMNADDLLQEAVVLLLAGDRRWPRGLEPVRLLVGTMRSIASNTRKKSGYLLAEDLEPPSDENSDVDASPIAEGISPHTDPARVVQAEAELIAVQSAVQGDDELELYIEALAEGLTGTKVAKELGWDDKKYDAIRKRHSRRLAALKTERS